MVCLYGGPEYGTIKTSGARMLADLTTALPDGVALPAPLGVFPRYVEPVA